MNLNKDLMSEVFKNTVLSYKFNKNSDNFEFICGSRRGKPFQLINKYELMHKMKEWALDNGYSLQSNFDTIKGYCNSMPLYWGTKSDGGHGFTVKGEDEFEAVYNAVEFIQRDKIKHLI